MNLQGSGRTFGLLHGGQVVRIGGVHQHRDTGEAGHRLLEELQQLADHLDGKILKRAKPGDQPIEQPTKFELTINTTSIGLENTRRHVAHWRERRPYRGAPMPAALWAAAVALARRHGLYTTARTLHVDYGSLKKRLAAAGARRVSRLVIRPH